MIFRSRPPPRPAPALNTDTFKEVKELHGAEDGGGGAGDGDDGEDVSQIYIYKLPIDRPSGCYW